MTETDPPELLIPPSVFTTMRELLTSMTLSTLNIPPPVFAAKILRSIVTALSRLYIPPPDEALFTEISQFDTVRETPMFNIPPPTRSLLGNTSTSELPPVMESRSMTASSLPVTTW